jgi:hypothetical protein
MASKPRVDYDLLLILGFCKFYEEDFGREVIDVGYTKSQKSIRKLVGDDLGGSVSCREENLCFMM